MENLEIRLVNVVVTVTFLDSAGNPVKLNLPVVASVLSTEAEVEMVTRKGFPALVAKFRRGARNKKISVLIFSSGRANVAGSKSLEEAKKVVERLIEILTPFGVAAAKVVPVNRVTTAYLRGYRVNLEKIAFSKELWNPLYDPDSFPAAVIRIPVGEGVTKRILLYSNGKMIIPAVSSPDEARELARMIVERLKKVGALIPVSGERA